MSSQPVKPHILLGICGSIAAYKALELIRLYKKHDINVTCIVTENAKRFVTPTTLEVLSGQAVLDNLSSNEKINHIDLNKICDIFMVIPATANCISKFALGLADDLLSSTWLNFKGKKCIAPAMHTNMWENPIIQNHIQTLRTFGCHIISPASGDLACEDTGSGRLADVSTLFAYSLALLQTKPNQLKNKRILITGGPMTEALDPVRSIINSSSGKLAHQLALSCIVSGAKVHLLTSLPFCDPQLLESVQTYSAFDQLKSFLNQVWDIDYIFMAAAVSDYSTQNISRTKFSSKNKHMSITLKKNDDLIQDFSTKYQHKTNIVGFCLVDSLSENERIQEKLTKKQLDLIIASSPKAIGSTKRDIVILHKNTDKLSHKNVSVDKMCQHIITESLKIKK